MPITLLDDDGNEIDLDKADGGTLRTKLEEALTANKAWEKEVATSRAVSAIGEHGYDLVKPEDFEGVSPDEVAEKAKELHEQRLEARSETVRSILAERGLEGSDLDSAVEGFLEGGDLPAGKPVEEPDFADLLLTGGARPDQKGKAVPMDDAMGNLTGHFEDKKKKSS